MWDLLGLPSCGVIFKDTISSLADEEHANTSELGILCWERAD